MKVSVLLLTFNEAKNLPRCLEALGWCDDVVVLDSGSTDGTVEIAIAGKARVLRRPFDNFAAQRNFGLDCGGFQHDWILHLDADEIVTPEFVEGLRGLKPAEGIHGYFVPSKLMLQGAWLQHSGMYPNYQVRLGHAERLRFKQVGHGQREDVPIERLANFDVPYLHFSFSRGLGDWLQKHLRYAGDEAQDIVGLRCRQGSRWKEILSRDVVLRRRGIKALSARIPIWLRPFARFLYVYIVRRGFLDGRAGLTHAALLSIYEAMISVLVAESLNHNRIDHDP